MITKHKDMDAALKYGEEEKGLYLSEELQPDLRAGEELLNKHQSRNSVLLFLHALLLADSLRRIPSRPLSPRST